MGAIPDTWYCFPVHRRDGVVVACSDAGDVRRVVGLEAGSNGVLAYFHCGSAGANARAAMTFGVVYAVFPFGKPAG